MACDQHAGKFHHLIHMIYLLLSHSQMMTRQQLLPPLHSQAMRRPLRSSPLPRREPSFTPPSTTDACVPTTSTTFSSLLPLPLQLLPTQQLLQFPSHTHPLPA